jgi:putative FmdB family regulatory protein
VPMYEFVCQGCQHEFEELVMSNSDVVECPRCTSRDVGKVLSRFAFKSGGVFRSSSQKSGCSGCHGGCSGGGCSGCG